MKTLKWIAAVALFLTLAGARGASAAGSPADAAAPATLTLPEAEQQALEHSPVYRRALDAEREAGWEKFQALSEGFLPGLTLSGQHFFNHEFFGGDPNNYTNLNVQFSPGTPVVSFPGIYPNSTLTLEAHYDLFDGFANVHRLDAANHRQDAQKVLSGFALLRLKEDVRLEFYKALASRLLSDMADQNVKTLEDHLRIVKDQLANGQATKYDVLRVEVQLSEAQSDQLSAHDNVALAREALSQAMGLPDDDRPLEGRMPVLDADALLKAAGSLDLEDSPELRAKRLQALAARDLSAASSASLWVPRISLVGQYQWYNSPSYLANSAGQDYFAYNNDLQTDYFVGASATWNLLDGGLSVAKANEAEERAREAEDDYASAELKTPYDFDLWKRRLVSSVTLYKAKLTDIDKARESARLATLGFKAGTRTTTDVLDAELDEYRASAELVQAQINSLEALVNLELVIGKKLPLSQ